MILKNLKEGFHKKKKKPQNIQAHLYEILQQTKLIYRGKNKKQWLLWEREEWDSKTERDPIEMPGVIQVLYLEVLSYTGICIALKSQSKDFCIS